MFIDPAGGLLTFWQHIQSVDVWLLTHINQDWGNGFLDTVLPFFRETLFWAPFYLFLLLFVTFNFGVRGWWWVLSVVLLAAGSDLISSHLIKESIWRTRPCQDPQVAPQIHFFINYCPQSSSFVSSHAFNHFAQAAFFYYTLRHLSKWWIAIFAWAFAISYTQIYVGVHYPFDVFCGGVLGFTVGWGMSRLFNRQIGLHAVS